MERNLPKWNEKKKKKNKRKPNKSYSTREEYKKIGIARIFGLLFKTLYLHSMHKYNIYAFELNVD